MLKGRAPIGVTVDEIDDLPKRLGTLIHAGGADFDILELDDLHPTELFRRHEVFAALRALRGRLDNPSTFDAAAAQVLSWKGEVASTAPDEAARTDQPATDFEALLGGSKGASPSRRASTVAELVRSLVSEFVVPAPDPRRDELVETVDRAIAAQMQRALHDPAWQGVEACWRSLEMLIQRLELGEELTLSVLDASRDEIAADLASENTSELVDLVVTRPTKTAGGKPWALVVWLGSFEATAADARLAAMLGALGLEGGCPVVAGAAPSLLGVADARALKDASVIGPLGGAMAELWGEIVKLPGASALALTAPRTLMRLPYGPKTDPVSGFAFDEASYVNGDHGAYLWGSSSVLVAIALGQAFTEIGWRLDPSGAADIDDLPVHVRTDGEMQPCAEAWLSDRVADALAQRGLCPLLSVQNRGAVRLAGIRSLAGGPLAARWA